MGCRAHSASRVSLTVQLQAYQRHSQVTESHSESDHRERAHSIKGGLRRKNTPEKQKKAATKPQAKESRAGL
jgi:hypothetical protein